MNIADSIKHVLKNKSHVFSKGWKEEISQILKEISDDVNDMVRSGGHTFKEVKGRRLKISLQDAMDSASDAFIVAKVLPKRIQEGFHFFKQDLFTELEDLYDPKKKAIFSLKVLGALTSFSVSTIYNVKKGNLDLHLNGVKKINSFSRFLIGEVLLKVIRIMLIKFLNELQQTVTHQEDEAHIRYFRELLISRDKPDESHMEETDPAIEIVENLKKYIMTGQRGIE